MVSFYAPHRDNPDIPHIPTSHTHKPLAWTYIAADPNTGENTTDLLPEQGTESERQTRVTACDCDNASGDSTTGTDAGDNTRGEEDVTTMRAESGERRAESGNLESGE